MTSKFTPTLLQFHPVRAKTRICILPPVNFLASGAPLRIGHAVAALLVLEDGRYIMQLRDALPASGTRAIGVRSAAASMHARMTFRPCARSCTRRSKWRWGEGA